jgi:hypothetical protein
MSDSGAEPTVGDEKDGTDAGVPQGAGLDGDAVSGAVTAGQVPGGNDAMPADLSGPPIDGGVLGAEEQNTDVGAAGETGVNDKGGELPPEEMNR